ncbi:LPD7 domain-containing protein, partial [Nitrosococcus oceani]|uniref:LPD7 domain-containing protein n=1 Tax=Nitrosococcus oceani TaxID=1229 RepID=UPI00055BB94B
MLPDTSPDALRDILIVAMKKYGSHLAINGTESFRVQIAEVAAQNHMRVTFNDERLEQYRQQLMKHHRINSAQSIGRQRSISTPRRS